MKLSKTQINSIVNKIESAEKKKMDVRYKKKLDAEVKAKTPIAKKYFALWNDLPKEVKKLANRYDNITEKSILDSLVKCERERFCRSEMEDKIILASIDANDLTELQSKLNIKLI